MTKTMRLILDDTDEQDLLKIISNTLLINTQYIENIGLVNGRLGVALFYYTFSERFNISHFQGFADVILENTYVKFHEYLYKQQYDITIAELVECYVGIELLINQNFIDGDLSEIISILDKYILSHLEIGFQPTGLLFYEGLYLIHRYESNPTSKDTDNYMSTFLNVLLRTKCLVKQSTKISYIHSILYFLSRIQTKKHELLIAELIKNIIEEVYRVKQIKLDSLDILRFNEKSDFSLCQNINSETVIDTETNLSNDCQSLKFEDVKYHVWYNIMFSGIDNSKYDFLKYIPERAFALTDLHTLGLLLLKNKK